MSDSWIDSPLPKLLKFMKSGGTPDTSQSSFYGGEIPFVAIDDMTRCSRYLERTSKTLTSEGLRNSNAWLVPAGALLYSIYATLGVPRINKIPVATNQAILALLNDPDAIDGNYLYHWLSFIRDSVVSLSSQTTQSNLSASVVKTFLVSHPESLPEQTKIAEILSTVDQAIDQTKALIAKQQRTKTGMMQDLLTHGIDKDGNLRFEDTHEFKDSPIGRIPVEWGSGYFQSCILGSPKNGIYKPQSAYGEEGTPIIRIDGFGHGDRIKSHSYKRIRLSKSEIDPFRLRDGEILINRVNSIQYLGKTALVEHLPEPTVFESNMMKVTIDRQRMLPDFAFLILTSPAASGHFLSNAKLAIAQASINQHDVKSLQIQCPHLEEQCAICERIASIDSSIRNTLSGLKKLHRIKTALMQDLLTGKVLVTPLLTEAEVCE